jgi:hypothetical protein
MGKDFDEMVIYYKFKVRNKLILTVLKNVIYENLYHNNFACTIFHIDIFSKPVPGFFKSSKFYF